MRHRGARSMTNKGQNPGPSNKVKIGIGAVMISIITLVSSALAFGNSALAFGKEVIVAVPTLISTTEPVAQKEELKEEPIEEPKEEPVPTSTPLSTPTPAPASAPTPAPTPPPTPPTTKKEAVPPKETSRVAVALVGKPGTPYRFTVEYLSCGCTDGDRGIFGPSGQVQRSVPRPIEAGDSITAYFEALPHTDRLIYPMQVRLHIDGIVAKNADIQPRSGSNIATLRHTV